MHVSTRIGGPSERVAPSLPIVLGSFEVALEAASLTSLFAAEDGEFGLVEFRSGFIAGVDVDVVVACVVVDGGVTDV